MSRFEDQKELARRIWSDSWLFYMKYHGRPAEPGMWEEATKDFGEIMRKYSGETLCARMMLAAFSLLEEETR